MNDRDFLFLLVKYVDTMIVVVVVALLGVALLAGWVAG